MKLSANHLKRYQQVVRLFWKYGRSDLVQHMNLGDEAIDTKELTPAGFWLVITIFVQDHKSSKNTPQ